MRWLPGLQIARNYELAWLRSDIVAGIVLSTMLVPVGIAYAVASGVPAIYGLYATIVPLLVYALFGPSRILVLGPDSSLAAVILGVVLPLSVRRSDARRGTGGRDGDRLGSGLHHRRAWPAGLHYRAALKADPLRLHERDRAGRPDQPAAQAARLLDRKRGPAPGFGRDRRRHFVGQGELGRSGAWLRHACDHPASQAVQANPDRAAWR